MNPRYPDPQQPDCYPIPLDVRLLQPNGCCSWRLIAPFMYVGLNEVVEMPSGSTTDFASIPRVLHPILPPTGRYAWAAVIHDFCYRTGHKSRAVSDAILKDGMEHSNVKAWQVWVIYLAVRIFGSLSYQKPREKKP